MRPIPSTTAAEAPPTASAVAVLSALAARVVPSAARSQCNLCTVGPRSCRTNQCDIGTRTASPGLLQWSRRGQPLTNRMSAPAADPAAAVAAAAVWWRECHRLHATAPCPAAAPDRRGQQAGVLRAQECGWQNQPRAAALRPARLLCTRPRQRSAGAVCSASVVDFHPLRRATSRVWQKWLFYPQRQVCHLPGALQPPRSYESTIEIAPLRVPFTIRDHARAARTGGWRGRLRRRRGAR